MLKIISEIFEFSMENSCFERIRMVRMVRMVRSLADRTFQLGVERQGAGLGGGVRSRSSLGRRRRAVAALGALGLPLRSLATGRISKIFPIPRQI